MNEPYTISKITLGTVQLGIPYGVANTDGQPTPEYGHQLLQYAWSHGIRSLDTARIYGNAEEVIGSCKNAGAFTLISKFKLSNAALADKTLAIKEASESVKTSCKFLGVNRIPIVLFHKDKEQPIDKAMQVLPVVFERLKNEGLISEGGISVYTPNELLDIPDWNNINSVQVPMNVFDTRLLHNGILQTLTENGVKIFIRSVFLQGLIAIGETGLPEHLSFSKPFLHKLKLIANQANRELKELAFVFVRDTPGISSIVIGAETIEQLRENIQLLTAPPLPENIHTEIKQCFKNVPEQLITPALWKI
jgi:aryl-alcohol dehydrogenase-like predicted oxidoreductase